MDLALKGEILVASDVNAQPTEVKKAIEDIKFLYSIDFVLELKKPDQFVEKELKAPQNIDKQPKKKNTVDSKTISNIISIIVGGAIFAFFAFIIISGGGPLLVLFGLFIGALLLKCMR